MVNRAFHLSSTWDSFTIECERIESMSTKLKYPESLVNSTIIHFSLKNDVYDIFFQSFLQNKLIFR